MPRSRGKPGDRCNTTTLVASARADQKSWSAAFAVAHSRACMPLPSAQSLLKETLPKSPEAQVLGKQLLRSGTSVGANYREAHRGRSKPEFIAKCGDSLREIEESAYWLELLVESRIVKAEKLQPLRDECDELTAIFVTIIKRARSSG